MPCAVCAKTGFVAGVDCVLSRAVGRRIVGILSGLSVRAIVGSICDCQRFGGLEPVFQ